MDKTAALVGVLAALSGLFSGGGENMADTVPELGKAYREFVRAWGEEKDRQWFEEFFNPCTAERTEMCFEFNRLFVGPTPPVAPPYESVYLSPEPCVMQAQTLEVRRLYQSEGLMAAAQGEIPDDFIGTELEFAAYLLKEAGEEAAAGKERESQAHLELFNLFISEHLLRWQDPFCRDVCENTRHPFFPFLMEILLNVLRTCLTVGP
ncbi:Tat proofreading chaperone DmsD [Peptococcaceae bacterium CEB3]|nr:Tat proofreading chaperone DmsD [Peptococcaceae bacterium CEB3]